MRLTLLSINQLCYFFSSAEDSIVGSYVGQLVLTEAQVQMVTVSNGLG